MIIIIILKKNYKGKCRSKLQYREIFKQRKEKKANKKKKEKKRKPFCDIQYSTTI